MQRSFASALEGGHRAERTWVQNLRALGRSVAHGKKIVIAGHNKNTDHCETPDAVGLVSLEIKERSLTFTCPDDYPYETVFVDDMRGLGKETMKHLAYVYISRPTGQWVWLTMLDRDDSWVEKTVWDSGRSHEVPTLVAPKRFLRPAQTLIDHLYPHSLLSLIDGELGGTFERGGGKVERRDRTPAKANPAAGSRDRKAAGKGHKHVG
jgi:hypothetical protein